MSAKSSLLINGFAILNTAGEYRPLSPVPCKTFFDRSPDLLQKGEAGNKNNTKCPNNENPNILSRNKGHQGRIRDPVHLPIMCSREYNRQQDAQGPFPGCPGGLLPALQGTPDRADTRQGPLAGDTARGPLWISGSPQQSGRVSCSFSPASRMPAGGSRKAVWPVDRVQFPFYTVIFLKRNAPMIVVARLNPPMTAKQTNGLIWDTPVRPYRIPSTP
jgi:hypothetical protein